MNSRKIVFISALIGAMNTPLLAVAQHDQHSNHSHADQHSQPMDHSAHNQTHNMSSGATVQPTEAGQDAFAAIQEVVAILEADPNTDWSRVNIDTLRDHLIDMHLVTLYANVQAEQLDTGMRYRVTGDGDTIGAIQRMVSAHAQQISSDTAWQASTSEIPDGLMLTVTATDPADTAKIRGLGFAGFMVQGNHHQPHHLMMATGAFGHHH